jgi:hypothetical protein
MATDVVAVPDDRLDEADADVQRTGERARQEK